MRIVYIGGWMRSGTTLLCEMAGAFDGTLALGELSGIWRAADRDEQCSCGAPILTCPVWRPALQTVHAEHGIGRGDYGAVAAQARDVLRTRASLSLAKLASQDASTWPKIVVSYRNVMHTLLRAVSEQTGAEVLVDSSKLPPGFLISRLMPDVDVDLLHIIRDPRAVANSELKTRVRQGQDAEMLPPGRSAVSSVIYWSGANLAVKRCSSYARKYIAIDYEILTTETNRELTRIAAGLGLTRTPGKMLDSGHIAVGNPARLAGSNRAVSLDDSWKQELSTTERRLVSAISVPARLLLRDNVMRDRAVDEC